MEKSWHIRIPTLEEERRYRSLIDLHHLTQEWLATLEVKQRLGEVGLERFVPLTLTQNLWLLEKIRMDRLPPELSEVVEETSVSEFLDRLSETLWTVHLAVLSNILSNSKGEDQEAVLSAIRHTAWQVGRKQASKKWKELLPLDSLEHIDTVLKASSFGRFWVLRKTKSEADLIWLDYPKKKPAVRIHSYAPLIQLIHEEWVSGTLYGLNSVLRSAFGPETNQGLCLNLHFLNSSI